MKGIRTFRGIVFLALLVFVFPFMTVTEAKAADLAMFSVTANKTSYSVGDDITVSLSVDAGPYASTLSVIDMDIKTSDASVITPKDSTSPFVPGSIFSSVGMQSVKDNITNIVVYINPSNKPASRSGLIGTITFKAMKEGSATVSYDKIEAAEEGQENQWANTAASSVVISVSAVQQAAVETTATPASSNNTQAVSSSASVSSEATAVASTAKKTAAAAATGPEAILYVIILGVGIMFITHKVYKNYARKI